MSLRRLFLLFAATPVLVAGASLQEQVDATPEGGVLILPAGTHEGPVRIEKSMTLRGEDGSVVDGMRRGSVITVTAPDVRIENLAVVNSGLNLERDEAGIKVEADRVAIVGNAIESCLHGIYFKKVNGGLARGNRITGATIEGDAAAADILSAGVSLAGETGLCEVGQMDVNRRGNGIHLWNTRGVLLERNEISRTRDGIYFSFADDCRVENNVVTDCRYGLHYMYSDGNAFSGNRFTRNAAGAALMYSGRLEVADNAFSGNRGGRAYGLLLQSVDASAFRDNEIRDNTIGLYAENSQGNLLVGNRLEKNYVAFRLGGSSRDNRMGGNRFARNTHRVEVAGQPGMNQWSVEGRGNYWDGMAPPDLDGNGTGELPHREADLLGGLRQQFPLAGLLSGSPGLELLRFASSRSELPGVRAVEDPHPLTQP